MKQHLHIWITGASRGIGAAIAAAVTANGHRVSLSSRNEASLQQVHTTLPASTSQVVMCDVADADSVSEAHAACVGGFGPVDVLINNAGIGLWQPLTEMPVESFDDQVAINLRGTFLCCKVVLPTMIERSSGHIITINSVAARKAFAGNTAYAATKAGALALTQALREEVRASGIKVTDLLIGATETDIWPEDAREQFSQRMMQAEDCAQAIASVIQLGMLPRMHIEEMVLRPQLGDL